jgi:hypothetical protein
MESRIQISHKKVDQEVKKESEEVEEEAMEGLRSS